MSFTNTGIITIWIWLNKIGGEENGKLQVFKNDKGKNIHWSTDRLVLLQ